MKHIKIGMFGCAVGTANLGCCALSYSLINLLAHICNEQKIEPEFIIFDFSASEISVKKMCDELRIDPVRFKTEDVPFKDLSDCISILKTIKNISKSARIYGVVKKCDIIIDLTQGDSFSDIYGLGRFYRWTNVKRCIEKMGIPLILGPQTYGPYDNTRVKGLAKKVIEEAAVVLSRDQTSADYIYSFCDKNVIVCTDLAFQLPYRGASENKSRTIKVGINPSGLLGSEKNDRSAFNGKLTVDYDSYIKRLVSWLVSQGNYEVHMISHVGNEAIECFSGFEGVIYHKAFNSPIDAKNLISQMDIFVGSRMHATIAALSSGVATIPVAYSRKFSGLFGGLGYDYSVNLLELTTEEALNKTIEYIRSAKVLRIAVNNCKNRIRALNEITYKTFTDLILTNAKNDVGVK